VPTDQEAGVTDASAQADQVFSVLGAVLSTMQERPLKHAG
jgi:hypothetical protein